MKPDVNYCAYSDQDGVEINGGEIESLTPTEYDDILKLSNCTRVRVSRCVINSIGGNREDGVDIMRGCRDVVFNECDVGAGERYAFTLKGGSQDILLRRVSITRPGRWVDIDIGNYSSTVPDAKTSKVMLISVTRSDGKPVRVRVGFADDPVIVGGNVKVLRCQSLALKAYVWFRRKFWR